MTQTLEREKLWAVQTPQAFAIKTLRSAYRNLPEGVVVTDDCQAVEMAGEQVRVVESNRPNIKITTVEDLQVAAALLK